MKTPFPRTGQHFGCSMPKYPDSYHSTAIFKCLASDAHKVIRPVLAAVLRKAAA